MRKSNQQSLKEVLNEMMEVYQLRNKLNDTKVVAHWREIMGNTIAQHTTKLYINKGILYIYLDSAPLRHELNFGKDKIMTMLNKKIGSEHITKVVLR